MLSCRKHLRVFLVFSLYITLLRVIIWSLDLRHRVDISRVSGIGACVQYINSSGAQDQNNVGSPLLW